MADYRRNDDYSTRDRESSRYGRDMDLDRGGWGRDRDRQDEGRSRGGGFFGSGKGRDDDGWSSGRREELGWGTDDRSRSAGGREERSWFGGGSSSRNERSRDDRGRDDRGRGDHARDERGRDDRSREERGWSADAGRSDRGREQRGRDYGYDDQHEGLPIDETSRLIASNKVEGTAVYSRTGTRLGSIYNFMVDKRSGKVEYAVMTYGGFLGMGTRYYPMPWDILEYDTRLGGYRVDMMERDLERAPSFDRNSEPEFDSRYGERVRGWYGLKV